MKLYAHDGTLRIPSAASGSPQRLLIFEAFLEMIINMAIDLKKDIRSSDLTLKSKRTAWNQKIHQTREIVPLFPASAPGSAETASYKLCRFHY